MASEFLTKKFAKIFQRYDADSTNYLESSDFVLLITNYLNSLGIDINSPEGKKAVALQLKVWESIKGFDTDGDGKITLDEYVKGWETLHQQGTMEHFFKEYVNLLVDTYDTDVNGQVSREEFSKLVYSEVSPEAFQKLDTKGAGYLTKDDLLNHMVVYFSSEDPSQPGNSFFGSL
jgi:Ca2+-binding EF-hand superfamily protein